MKRYTYVGEYDASYAESEGGEFVLYADMVKKLAAREREREKACDELNQLVDEERRLRQKAEAEVKALREELAALPSVLRQCVRAMDDAAESLRAGKVTSPAPLLTTIREVKINDEDFPPFLESKEEA